MKSSPLLISAAALGLAAAVSLTGQEAAPPAAGPSEATPSVTLFNNVRVFDGKSDKLSAPVNVLVRGNKIDEISADPIATDRRADTRIIDGSGKTLMPGLIDAHWHSLLAAVPLNVVMTAGTDYLNLLAGGQSHATLMRGFTTIRDLGGPTFGLKRAIDEGAIAGPRIYPSGAMISITGGHGDFRQTSELPRIQGGPLSHSERIGASMIADSPDEVRLRVREQLMLGATQIKLTAGGGVASPHSPLDVATFTEPELRAAVEAAENWGTYVTVHAYTPPSIQRAIEAGVKCIEHGHLMDEPSARMMAGQGVWLSIQPFPEEMGNAFPPGSEQRAKFQEVLVGTDTAYRLARKHGIKIAFGTDILFSPGYASGQNRQLLLLTKWFTPAEILVMATSTNAGLLALCGKRNPYPGKLGVIEEGAYADLLLVNGNPLENLDLVADPEKNFTVIMKDGVIHKGL
jgi:imidazolonepropionase-like amidohydrolase